MEECSHTSHLQGIFASLWEHRLRAMPDTCVSSPSSRGISALPLPLSSSSNFSQTVLSSGNLENTAVSVALADGVMHQDRSVSILPSPSPLLTPPLIGDTLTAPPSPLLLCLSTGGVLCPFWVVHLPKKPFLKNTLLFCWEIPEGGKRQKLNLLDSAPVPPLLFNHTQRLRSDPSHKGSMLR